MCQTREPNLALVCKLLHTPQIVAELPHYGIAAHMRVWHVKGSTEQPLLLQLAQAGQIYMGPECEFVTGLSLVW